MAEPVDLLIHNIRDLVTIAGSNEGPRRGPALRDLARLEGGAVAISGDTLVAVGAEREVRAQVEVGPRTRQLDARGGTLTPGFVDPHTHLVFAGTRAQEFAIRVAGGTYEEILAAGGGINNTTRLTRAASASQLAEQAIGYLDRMLCHGTTTVEAKSGYGLDLESELKLLRVTRQLNEQHPLEIVSTFLGAHLVPAEYRAAPDDYVALIIDEMLPAVAAEGLAEYCDVWCDKGIFTVAQSERILRAARDVGLKLRLHANQLGAGGGTRLAVDWGATSVDHLERLPAEEIPHLAQSDSIAVLVPGVAYTVGGPHADARALIDAGAAVALATDFNPGSCFTESMPMVLSLACTQLGMSPAEVLVAATFNAACALDRGARLGSIEPGKQADLVLWDVPSCEHLPYHFGVNLVSHVIKAGRVVVESGQRVITP